MSALTALRVRAGEHEAWLLADRATAAGVAAAARPFFAADEAPPPSRLDGHMVVTTDRSALPGPLRRVVYPSPWEPDRRLLVAADERHVAVDEPDARWRPVQTLRTLRNLLRWRAHEAGALFLHGGLVRFGGAGVAFAGPKRSGKTTFLLSALANGDAAFVSNDDVSVHADGDAVTGRGWPRAVNVRRESVLALRHLRDGLVERCAAASHPHNRHGSNWTELVEGLPPDVTLLPGELAAVMGCAVVPDARLAALVLPSFDPDCDAAPRVELLAAQAARAALAGSVEPRPSPKYDPHLAAWFATDAGADARRALLDATARRLTCVRVRQTARSAPLAAREVRDLVVAEA